MSEVSSISRENLVEMIGKQTNMLNDLHSENAELREALKNSQQAMNTFGMIHGNGKYSNNEKCQRADKLIENHMDGIFTKNKDLLTNYKVKGE